MPIAPILQRFIDDELALAPALIGRVALGTMQLLGPSKEAAGTSERFHYADIVAALQDKASLSEKTFVYSLRRQIAEYLDAGAQSPAGEAKGDSLSLELMDESRVEVDIDISRAMQLIDSTAEWELRELQAFTSTLIGQNHVTAESNPFRPLVYATALWDAASAIVASQIQRAIVLRTSAGVAAGLLKNAAAAASTRLESQGVQPGLYRTVVLPSGSGFGRPVAEPPRQGALSGLLARMPEAAHPCYNPNLPCIERPSSSRPCCASTSCFATQRSKPRAREERRASGSRSIARPFSRARASPSIDR